MTKINYIVIIWILSGHAPCLLKPTKFSDSKNLKRNQKSKNIK